MKAIFAGVLIGICLPLVVGYLFVILGGMPVATKGGPLPIEKFLAKEALDAAIGKEAGKPPPLSADEANLLAGARVYEQAQCWVCHGQLGQPASAVAKGMYPPPPQLLSSEQGVTDDPVGVTYWKVKNGIRLTGMPDSVFSCSMRTSCPNLYKRCSAIKTSLWYAVRVSSNQINRYRQSCSIFAGRYARPANYVAFFPRYSDLPRIPFVTPDRKTLKNA